MFGRKKSDDNIGPSKGLMKWINRFFRFILYPFIHPKAFIFMVLLVIAAILIPMFVYKIEFSALPQWYKGVFNQAYEMIQPLKDKVIQKHDIKDDTVKKAEEVEYKKQDDIIEYETSSQAQRIIFQEDTTADNQHNDVVKREVFTEQPVEIVQEVVEQPKIEESTNKTKIFFKRNESLGLTYLDNPEEINGRFTIINANEALVDSTTIFLYGIYTPAQNSRRASNYMLKTYDGKQVKCYIGAYTSDNHATAICYYDDKSINHDMINQGFAQNVSLY